MRKKALHKSTVREIFSSKARFLSIFGIILLGVCFYAGIKATGPDMRLTADKYYQQYHLMDTRIVSTMGLTKEDQKQLSSDANVEEVQMGYSLDVAIPSENQVVHISSYDPKQKINQYRVIKGRLPEKSGEIALDARVLKFEKNPYQLGKSYQIDSDEATDKKFNKRSYKIVGFVNSPVYIESMSRGNTTVGKGSIDYFAVIPSEDFALDAYTEAFVRYRNVAGVDSYSDLYEQRYKTDLKQLKQQMKVRPEERQKEIQKEAQEKLASEQKKLVDGEQAIQKATKELADGRQALADGRQEWEQGKATFQTEIANAEQTIEQKTAELAQGKQALAEQKQQLPAAKQQLDQANAQLQTARQQLQNQGLDPDGDLAKLTGQSQQLEQLRAGYQQLAGSIATVQQQLPEGAPVPLEAIDGWSASAVQLQLPELVALLAQLKQDPTQVGLLGQMTAMIGAADQAIQGQWSQMQQAIQGLQQYHTGLAQYQAGMQQYQSGLSQVQAAENQLQNGETQLAQARQQLATEKAAGQAKLDSSEQQLTQSEAELQAGEQKLAKEQQTLANGKKKLADAQKEIDDIAKPKYMYFSRNDNPGYEEYKENANRISSIATVFPVFFFVIAALVCLTTMTRMVDEKRGEIGTLKALGYTNWEISQKYLVYSSVASIAGTLIGLVVGYNVFPTVIFNAYGAMYNFPPVRLGYYPSYTIQSFVVALLCTTVSSWVVLRVDLLSSPAVLMRPKAPKAGQRILLERIPFIWKRLNFIHKVTARNLFRYKQRMLMTVLGIAGCMGLLITGFGLRDSIADMVDIQFQDIWHYQGAVTFNPDATKKQTDEYNQKLAQLPEFKKKLLLAQETMQVAKKGKITQDVSIDVPETTKDLDQFITFKNRKTRAEYRLDDNGVIINEKLAKLFDLKEGMMLKLTDSDHQTYQVKINHIVENYVQHFIYMTPTYYEKIFHQQPKYETELLLLKHYPKNEDQVAQDLMDTKKAINVTFLSETSRLLDDTMGSLTIVTWVLIISAGLLAFIVLYNLTNINISERIRELSTIKVLGFYDKEVTMYVYRENMILTIIGILVGCVAGKLLHLFVLNTAELDMMMFVPGIHLASYLYAAALTWFFSMIVMGLMHRKLKKVDMIEALKSNE